MCRPKTTKEIRDELLAKIDLLCRYWSSQDIEPMGRARGLTFSILSILDGCTELPRIELVARPHPSDADFHRSNGDDWVEDGALVNSGVMLHEEWCRRE